MKKENYIVKILILCFTFIPSLTLFWDVECLFFIFQA